MRNQHECVGIIAEVLFEPITGFEVKMVGGFVEQQQVRLLLAKVSRAPSAFASHRKTRRSDADQSSVRNPSPVSTAPTLASMANPSRVRNSLFQAMVPVSDLAVGWAIPRGNFHMVTGEIFHLLFDGP